jgi:hypothetical protein
MVKHSSYERAQRAAETERMRQVEAQWMGNLPKATVEAFNAEVANVIARGPMPKQPDMAPGTQPNPPRPGHEPKPKKTEQRSKRSY